MKNECWGASWLWVSMIHGALIQLRTITAEVPISADLIKVKLVILKE